jgi:hypothetical protein
MMALGIPAIAWVENSALFFVLVAAGLIGIVAVFWGIRVKGVCAQTLNDSCYAKISENR